MMTSATRSLHVKEIARRNAGFNSSTELRVVTGRQCKTEHTDALGVEVFKSGLKSPNVI